MPAAAELASEFAAAAGPLAAGVGGGPHRVINPSAEFAVYRPPPRRMYTLQTSTPRPLRTHMATAAAHNTSDRTAATVNSLRSRRAIFSHPTTPRDRRHNLFNAPRAVNARMSWVPWAAVLRCPFLDAAEEQGQASTPAHGTRRRACPGFYCAGRSK